MQCVVASGREGIGVGAMPQQGIGDFVEPEDGHVDERGIAEFIDGVDISSMGRQKPHAFGETLDSHEMKHGLVMNPACVEQIWMLCQKTGSSLLILNYGVDEFANERVRQVLRHRRANVANEPRAVAIQRRAGSIRVILIQPSPCSYSCE